MKYDGGGDWYGDPTSLVNLQKFIRENTGVRTAKKEVVVTLQDDDLFSYPFIYMTGHGNVSFSRSDVKRLQEYLQSGGFLFCDDNYGLDESFRREMKKVFPDRDLVELPFSHPIYHTAFDFPDGLPKIHEHDGKPAQGLAYLLNDRVAVFYSYQCDLGDGWEDESVHHDPPEKRLAALKMGTNVVLYALSGRPIDLP